MALISSFLPGFINGVSQQPYTLRLNSQGEHQENGISTISQGLRKRPPSKHLAKISSTPQSDVFVHTVNRDASERYVFMVTSGSLKIYSIDGVEQTVIYGAGAASYLTTALPAAESFAAVTIADYTWLVNKSKVVEESTSNTPASTNPHEALINVKSGNYGKTYEVIINGVQKAAYTTPNGTTAADSPSIATDHIASQLGSQLTANGISCYYSGNSIYVYSNTDFTIQVNDGFGNNAMVAIKENTQKFADLPLNPKINGTIIQVQGDASNSFSNYFVRFESAAGGSGGVWKECAAPNINLGLNPATMPFTVVRNADGTFTISAADWRNRRVGDLESSAEPSFVGRTINDVFFYQNRLGFLSDENVVMSESGKYFNLYRTTVTALLDSDPIDVTASHTKVSLLNYAVPFNKSLLLFSEQTQFIIPGDNVLTPTTISLKVSTEYPCDNNVKPLTAGSNCYFSLTKGNWSAVREYFTNVAGSGNEDAMEITAHIPKYIPAGIIKIAGSANEDTFAVLTKGDSKSLYMYKYFFTASNEKAQSSWSRWTFGAQDVVLNVDFIQSVMYLIISRPDGVYFESIDCSVGYIGTNEPYTVLLDRKITITPSTYNSATGFTEIPTSSFPYPLSDGKYFIVTQATGISSALKPGEFAQGEVVGSNIRFQGNFAGSALTFGRQYTFDYGISTITYKVANTTGGGGQRSDTEGRLQIRKLVVNYADTGYLRAEVTPQGRDTGSYVFSGKVVGNSSATIGRYAISSGRLLIPVLCRNTDAVINLKNDTPVPSSLISADWEGFYVKRSSAV